MAAQLPGRQWKFTKIIARINWESIWWRKWHSLLTSFSIPFVPFWFP
jgi:hypothetical protein